MRFYIILILTSLISIIVSTVNAQTENKILNAVYCDEPPIIDGDLSDQIWQKANIANDFLVYEPNNGEPPFQKTEVKVLYDNHAIYIGAWLYDNNPDSIYRELSIRDNDNANCDYFSFLLSPFNDGLNAYEFSVSASGVQTDIKYSNDDEDYDWNPVWHSMVKIDTNGWFVEFKIPYSAIRFSKKDEQKWAINFYRTIRRNRETSTWNYVNNDKDDLVQMGYLTGIKNIKPPLRLSLTPYISGYIENDSEIKETGYRALGGMDLKYGINESFTLDMTLIPDFGQVQSDDKILNLSPYEVAYDEKRPFFTEGTELFNKCEVFYSRRIGDEPEKYEEIEEDTTIKEIINNPEKTNLLNATKISGRTKSGLGIGVFNALTNQTVAEVIDIYDNYKEITTQKITNYNMLVFDQIIGDNSYISLVNTNVQKSDYMANVTGTEFSFNDEKNNYNIFGKLVSSQLYYNQDDDIFGYQTELGAGKISGKYRYYFTHSMETENYDPNDMGYNEAPNNNNFELELSHHIFKPTGILINMHNNFTAEYSRLYKPNEFAYLELSYESVFTTKKYITFFFDVGGFPVDYFDYYEPRIDGKVFNRKTGFYYGGFISSDYRKKIAVDLRSNFAYGKLLSKREREIMFRIRYRINNRIMFIPKIIYEYSKNDAGFVDYVPDTIYFGKRDVQTIETNITTSFSFTPKMALNFRLRHYWSQADYNEFFILSDSGDLTNCSYNQNQDINFNTFNIDLVFTWYFSPGSEMNIVWKNNIMTIGDKLTENYYHNFENTLKSPQVNSLSIKILYYLDYQSLKKH